MSSDLSTKKDNRKYDVNDHYDDGQKSPVQLNLSSLHPQRVVMVIKSYLAAAALLASPFLARAQDLIPPILETADVLIQVIWSVEESQKIIYIDDDFASVSDDDGLALIPPTALDFATTFRDDINEITGLNWTLKQTGRVPADATGISLGAYTGKSSDFVYADGKSTSEGYEIFVNSSRITIGGNGARGMWWGTRTLLQLLLAGNGTITATEGRDAPAYATRGYMLDAGRNGIPKTFSRSYAATRLSSK